MEKTFSLKNYLSALILPILLVILEFMFKITDRIEIDPHYILGTILSCFGIGMLFNIFLVISKNEKFNRVLMIIFAEMFTIIFLIMFFMDDAYSVLMDIEAIVSGAGDVVSDFMDTLISIVTGGILYIILYHIPVVLLIIFRKKLIHIKREKMWNGFFTFILTIVMTFVFGFLTFFVQTFTDVDKANYKYNYNFDQVGRLYGITTTLRLDIKYMIFEQPSELVKNIPTLDGPRHLNVKGYQSNVLDIDFEYLINNTTDSDLKKCYNIIKNDSGTKKNKYTGLFEGKNLILITAESFTKEVIDKDLTPTLYRLANNGIVFNDFYQPAWGGSTSTGEYSVMTGFIPTAGVNSMKKTADKDMWTTVGSMLKDKGYTSYAYHDHNYRYYSRHLTHENLGYKKYIGYGNGMEKGIKYVWPESDLEMMKWTIPQYINSDNFSVYYMTVSGHPNYTMGGNAMTRKNMSRVKGVKTSDPVKGYLACNMELEDAMTYLVDELEKAGKAEDTVIVLTSDHYPYGLNDSATWGTDYNYLKDLYGFTGAMTDRIKDHNALIMWSGCLEGDNTIYVDTPAMTLDIQPTLLNLFGLEYDSRIYSGRDVFAKGDPVVIWINHNWLTDKGYYNATKGVFTPTNKDEEVSQNYIDRINAYVSNKFTISKGILNTNLLAKIDKMLK